MDATRGWQDDVGSIGRRVGVPATIAIVGLTALSTLAGLLVTGFLDDSIGRWDLEVARTLVGGRTDAINSMTGAATVIADSLTVAGLWIGAMAVGRWRSGRWQLPLFFLTAIGGEKLTYLFTSIAVGRPRPPVPPLGHVFSTNSFPSGHVGAALTLYGGVAVAVLWHRGLRPEGLPSLSARVACGVAVGCVVVLVGFSRMSRGHHYLSDVVWGVALGLVWLAVAWRLVLRVRA